MLYMKYFFTYESELPAHVGFPMFGQIHMVWLCSIFFFLLLLLFQFHKKSRQHQLDILNLTSYFLLILEIGRLLYLWKIHFLSVHEFPLHLCGIAGFLCFFHIKSGWNWIGQTLFAACLPGTIVALIFPDWIMYPPINVITIHSFIFHTTIVFYCCAMVLGKFCIPTIKQIWMPILFLLLCAFPINMFNGHFHTNYMFLKVPSAGSPLIWIAHITGPRFYLPGYALFACFVMVVMYVIYYLFKTVYSTKKI